MLIYKILLPTEWTEFQTNGHFDGSTLDNKSGFIHCSSRDQVGGVAQGLFGQEPELVVVALNAETLGQRVRWEPVPDAGAFPHVYTPLPIDAVVAVHRITGASSVDEVLPPG